LFGEWAVLDVVFGDVDFSGGGGHGGVCGGVWCVEKGGAMSGPEVWVGGDTPSHKWEAQNVLW
jgi:hypothetical protein